MGPSVKTQTAQTPLSSGRWPATQLWPIRYKPLPDELLSCWLVRLARGHGLKVQTFCNAIFGEHLQVWNRDIDRLAPPWLLTELSIRTGTPYLVVAGTTLRTYESVLYRKFRPAGPLHWILLLKMYHRKRLGFGLQYCPTCLAEGDVPYFRKRWRVALSTVCSIHKTMLLDRCPSCEAAVAAHRIDFNRLDPLDEVPISFCHRCDFDLRTAPAAEPISYDGYSFGVLLAAGNCIDGNAAEGWTFDRYAVLHQLCRLMTARYKHVGLRGFVLEQIGARDISLTQGYVSFEMRPLAERHHLLLLTAWLMTDLEPRLHAAWQQGCVRYSVLTKDFPGSPEWYRRIVANFENWRNRFL
ncbi:TniQ family protein [Massilia scottii]|uniref:TniQ family protein n=1 Tax=Massilia scottii TaxID=3057166 RepID=UPI0035B5060F